MRETPCLKQKDLHLVITKKKCLAEKHEKFGFLEQKTELHQAREILRTKPIRNEL